MSIPESRRSYREAVEAMYQPEADLLIQLSRKGVGLPWYLEIGNPVSLFTGEISEKLGFGNSNFSS